MVGGESESDASYPRMRLTSHCRTRSLDKPDVYSEILTKVLRGAHILGTLLPPHALLSSGSPFPPLPLTDAHLELLLDKRGPQGPYAELTLIERARIEQRLKRASDFFGQVVCRFVMRDIGMLVDKCTSWGSASRHELGEEASC